MREKSGDSAYGVAQPRLAAASKIGPQLAGLRWRWRRYGIGEGPGVPVPLCLAREEKPQYSLHVNGLVHRREGSLEAGSDALRPRPVLQQRRENGLGQDASLLEFIH